SFEPIVQRPGAVLPELGFETAVAAKTTQVPRARTLEHEPCALVVLRVHCAFHLEQEAAFSSRDRADDPFDRAVPEATVGPLRLQHARLAFALDVAAERLDELNLVELRTVLRRLVGDGREARDLGLSLRRCLAGHAALLLRHRRRTISPVTVSAAGRKH